MEGQVVERHPSAIVESNQIGLNTKIGANAHILAGAIVGDNCDISEGAIINSGAILGNGVLVGSGALIDSKVIIENGVTIGACAVFTKETAPGFEKNELNTLVQEGAIIGANATILRGAKIGHRAHISPGAVVSQNIPQNAIVQGNPAQIVGYVNSARRSVAGVTKLDVAAGEVYSSKVSGVSVLRLPSVPDLRGNLSFGEFEKWSPFPSTDHCGLSYG